MQAKTRTAAAATVAAPKPANGTKLDLTDWIDEEETNRIAMTASKLLLAVAALATVQAELLRGNLPDKKELKRLNQQRHQLNAARAKKELEIEKSAWKELTKEEKKELLEELKRDEERVADDEKKNKDKSKDKGKKDDEESKQSKNPIHQYHTLLDSEINSNELNAIWKSLSKDEKKQVLALQEGRLIFDKEGNLVDNPDYFVEKLTKEEKKEMMKAEKEKEENKPSKDEEKPNKGDKPNKEEENDMQPNSQAKPNSKPEEDDMKPNNSVANTFVNTNPIVIEYQPEVEETSTTSTTTTTTTTKKPKTSTTTMTEKEEDMTPNSQAKPNDANDFVNPMPSLTFSSSAATTTTTSTTTTSAEVTTAQDTEVTSTYTFAKQLPDPSKPLNQEEERWTIAGQPWFTQTAGCYTDSCVMSGINESMGPIGVPVYSNMTLTTKKDFKGGIFTFLVKGKTRLPNEAFSVSVDEEIASSVISEDGDWVEYGVAVDQGQHAVTWSHISNPFGLEALPFHSGGALMIDDLRYSPFQKIGQTGILQDFDGEDEFIMTTDGDATWEMVRRDGSHSIQASTNDIDASSGSSNVNFVLYSKEGGTLKYNLLTSTTAPHDDFVILLNGKPVEAVFGLMMNFEKRSLDIPSGKVVVTFQHRKNPGQLSKNVLETLGAVKTEGFTRLDDVKFKIN